MEAWDTWLARTHWFSLYPFSSCNSATLSGIHLLRFQVQSSDRSTTHPKFDPYRGSWAHDLTDHWQCTYMSLRHLRLYTTRPSVWLWQMSCYRIIVSACLVCMVTHNCIVDGCIAAADSIDNVMTQNVTRLFGLHLHAHSFMVPVEIWIRQG